MNTPRAIPILAYHSISPLQNEQDAHLTVTPEHFAEHMSWLAAQGYQTLTLSQYFQQSDRLPERAILLTFDDGYTDFAEHALSILQRHSFSATLYMVTAYAGRFNDWERRGTMPRRQLLGWNELAALPIESVEIGAHSHTHPVLDLLPIEQARDEIQRSKSVLEKHLDRTIYTFCYPHGYYNQNIQHFVSEAGYTTACAVLDAMQIAGETPLALARLAMNDLVTIPMLEAKLRQPPIPAWLRAMRRGLTAIYRPYRAFKQRVAAAN